MYVFTNEQLVKAIHTIRTIQSVQYSISCMLALPSDCLTVCTRNLGDHRQSAVNGRTCCCSLPQWLLPATTSSSSAVTVYWRCQDTSPRLCVQPTGLLQCTTVWRVWRAPASRIQSVQNAAARLATGARRSDHVTPILRQLHWLPVRQRVQFKVGVLVFQCLSGNAPICQTTVSSWLTSACADSARPTQRRVLFDVHATPLACFATARPRWCNSLSSRLRQCDTPGEFKRLLRTHLFGDHSALWHFL